MSGRRETIGDLVADLARAFPRQNVSVEMVDLYLRDLDDLDLDALAGAVRDLRRTCEFFPTLRAIREAVAERVLALPREAEALAQVAERVRWLVSREGDPPPLHPLVKQAVDLVGGVSAFRHADNPGIIQGQMLRLFREARADAVRTVQVEGTLLLEAAPERGLPQR